MRENDQGQMRLFERPRMECARPGRKPLPPQVPPLPPSPALASLSSPKLETLVFPAFTWHKPSPGSLVQFQPLRCCLSPQRRCPRFYRHPRLFIALVRISRVLLTSQIYSFGTCLLSPAVTAVTKPGTNPCPLESRDFSEGDGQERNT